MAAGYSHLLDHLSQCVCPDSECYVRGLSRGLAAERRCYADGVGDCYAKL